MKGAKSCMKIILVVSQKKKKKKILWDKWAIFNPKTLLDYNSGFSLMIFVEYCIIKEAKLFIKIVLIVFPKKFFFSFEWKLYWQFLNNSPSRQLGHFWLRDSFLTHNSRFVLMISLKILPNANGQELDQKFC